MKSSFSLRALGIIMAFLPAIAVAEWNLNFTPAVTLLGEEIQAIHNLVMWIIVGISIVVPNAASAIEIGNSKNKFTSDLLNSS